jgi:hypothetical protein
MQYNAVQCNVAEYTETECNETEGYERKWSELEGNGVEQTKMETIESNEWLKGNQRFV